MNETKNEKIKSRVSKKAGKHQKAYYINPDIFEWGREYANLTIEEASNKLGIPKKLLKQIEKGAVDLTMNDLRKIGNLYNLSTAAFYLEEVPKEKETIEMSLDLRRDYRVKEMAMHLKLNTFGSLCLEYINENLDISESYVLADNIDEIERIRDFLNKIIEERKKEVSRSNDNKNPKEKEV
jgi:transcriptional regulator with XRE-family HTH domain